jgi:hypothetical protein
LKPLQIKAFLLRESSRNAHIFKPKHRGGSATDIGPDWSLQRSERNSAITPHVVLSTELRRPPTGISITKNGGATSGAYKAWIDKNYRFRVAV